MREGGREGKGKGERKRSGTLCSSKLTVKKSLPGPRKK